MNQNDKQKFAEAFIGTWELHGKTPAPEAIKLAFNALSKYPVAEVLQGLQRHVCDPDRGQFIPKPADIVRQMRGTPESRALAAWATVEHGIRGGYQSKANYVVFDDPIVHMVVSEMGGFSRLGARNESDMPFIQRDFINRFEMRSQFPTDNYPAKLPTSDQPSDHRANVLFIGNKDKCLAIENSQSTLEQDDAA